MGRGRHPGDVAPPETRVPPLVGGPGLKVHRLALRGIEFAHHLGTIGGAFTLLAIGGFVPVLGGWLRDEIESWRDVFEALGGVLPRAERNDPDGDLGPVLGRSDAPVLFAEVEEIARRLGVRPPGQIRLTYLPCCGVVAWGRQSRALVIGLPLLYVLDRDELRSVLTHELAHLARGDATQSVRSIHFIERLGRALECPDHPRRSGPLRVWARLCHHAGSTLLAPVVLGQEARADRAAATIAGGDATASALVKAALVQPLFREVLDHYDPGDPDTPNLYGFFRAFWERLPEPVLTAMRHRLLIEPPLVPDAAHPSLLDRLAIVQAYRSRCAFGTRDNTEAGPAASALGDLEALEQMLHNRLFGMPAVEPSVFHRAGS
ncbi:hypothetical protein BH23PLA1_BH23PLA1_27000 [soil metagenome]